MDTLIDTFSVTAHSEPIPGYRLEERIGVGGYGEVWRATAPGGLKKAVKIIHGQIGDTRAVRELKSLNRARGLNHPFLLSLERIEIVDGHLIIVTELADATLKNRFNTYTEQGLPGIPRDELLQYMREAADALDYLFDSYSLQHLDVKPENLLMVGSHIKVADFGLMKDLQESCASFVNGLTPRYSSPEMFEGKPGRHSDQYSLAIVYQEMISGTFPFAGNNIAALASQHLSCAPDLTALSPLERFAVGKALSKDPERRFDNCREFVERLMHRSSAEILTGSESGSERSSPAARSAGQGSGNRGQGQAAEGPSRIHDGQTIQLAAPEIRSLPKLKLDEKPAVCRPALFVGIGGTGGRVLARLRQLMADRLGQAKSLPALQFLYIDTDMDSVSEIAAGPWKDGLHENEIVVAPLRQTQDYRSTPVSSLDSISRRWIYNVPRSLRTQGLRALGRMALLDHSQRVLERLRTAVLACTDRQSISTSSTESGLTFQETDPRVFVVSSIGGGTGSGMTIDVGYAVRQILAECGYSDDEVCAILSYSTAAGAKSCSFAAANAYAFLDELRYFGQPGCDYPGEQACGLAGFREGGPTFSSAYLFDMGDNITSKAFAEATDGLSEYLFLNTVTSATAMFDECRRVERETPAAERFRLRTAGLCSFNAATRDDPGPFAELLCKFLVRKWKVGIEAATVDDQIGLSDFGRLYEACDPQRPSNSEIETLTADYLEHLDLTVQGVAKQIQTRVDQQLESDPHAYLRSVICDSLEQASGDESKVVVAIRRLRTIIGCESPISTSSESQVISLREKIIAEARSLGGRTGQELCGWILELVDAENARVSGARQAVEWTREHLDAVQAEAAEQLAAAKQATKEAWQAVAEIRDLPLPKRRLGRKPFIAALEQYGQRLLNELTCDATCKVLNAIDPCVTSASDQLRELWKDLSQFIDEFQVSESDSVNREEHITGGESRMATLFLERKMELIDQLDRAVEEQFFSERERLRQILTRGSHLRNNLQSRMRSLARQIVLRACRDDSHRYLRDALNSGGDVRFPHLVRKCVDNATPTLLTLGGSKRLLVASPGELDAEVLGREVEQITGEELNITREKNSDLQFCVEIEGLPWEGIQTRLIRQRHDCQELAARLHTRINLDWTIV